MTNPMLPTRCSYAPTYQTPIKQEYIYDIQAHVEHKVFIPRPITDASLWCNMSKCMPFKFLLALASCSISFRIIVVVCIIVNVCNCLFLQHVQVTPTSTIRLWGCIIVPMHTNEFYAQSYVLWLALGDLLPALMQTWWQAAAAEWAIFFQNDEISGRDLRHTSLFYQNG